MRNEPHNNSRIKQKLAQKGAYTPWSLILPHNCPVGGMTRNLSTTYYTLHGCPFYLSLDNASIWQLSKGFYELNLGAIDLHPFFVYKLLKQRKWEQPI